MAIILCSLHDRKHWRGAVYAITMRPIGALPLVECLRPSRELVWGIKYQGKSDEWYDAGYRRLLQARWSAVKAWMASLTAAEDVTLVCYCRPGAYCHRHLVARMLRKWRPDLTIETDDPLVVEAPQAPHAPQTAGQAPEAASQGGGEASATLPSQTASLPASAHLDAPHFYVDALIDYGGRYGRAGPEWCHLMTDGTKDDLHRFAARIGLKRAYFQDRPRGWHYGLTRGKRAQALRAGAVEIDDAQIRQLMCQHDATKEDAQQ